VLDIRCEVSQIPVSPNVFAMTRNCARENNIIVLNFDKLLRVGNTISFAHLLIMSFTAEILIIIIVLLWWKKVLFWQITLKLLYTSIFVTHFVVEIVIFYHWN